MIVHAHTLDAWRPLGVTGARLDRAATAAAIRIHLGAGSARHGQPHRQRIFLHRVQIRQSDIETCWRGLWPSVAYRGGASS
jgi:hypothetical protein